MPTMTNDEAGQPRCCPGSRAGRRPGARGRAAGRASRGASRARSTRSPGCSSTCRWPISTAPSTTPSPRRSPPRGAGRPGQGPLRRAGRGRLRRGPGRDDRPHRPPPAAAPRGQRRAGAEPRRRRATAAVAARYAGARSDVLRLAVPPRHAKVEAEPWEPAPAPGVPPTGESWQHVTHDD